MMHNKEKIDDNNLQKPNVDNQYLPFFDSIRRQASKEFEEIRMQLSRTIQLRKIRPGLIIWSNRLELFITNYGYYFTKPDRLKLINFHLSILSVDDLSFQNVKLRFHILQELLKFVP